MSTSTNIPGRDALGREFFRTQQACHIPKFYDSASFMCPEIMPGTPLHKKILKVWKGAKE